MNSNSREFVDFIFNEQIIKFGEFKLKSGRISPYFFNFGSFDDSLKLASLGKFYSQSIVDNNIDFDVIFGPAYKGIPISLATAMAHFYKRDTNLPYAFNRKEKKNYGEGGSIIGTPLKGKKVLAVDDVITSGRTIRETKEIVESEGGILSGFLVALDREEKPSENSRLTALQEASEMYGVRIYAVATISNVLDYINSSHSINHPYYNKISQYMDLYGLNKSYS